MIENGIVSKGIEYILLHIWENITLKEVAAYCNMSVSRFSDLFKEETGESVYAFIKRLKMEQSALCMKMEAQKTITDIGENYGYSASNYSSAFRQYHKKSPSEYRTMVYASRGEDQENIQRIIDEIDRRIRYEKKPDYTIVYERAIGSYEDLRVFWPGFIEKYQNDITEDTLFFERTFDDPTITDAGRCIYEVGMTTKHVEKYKNLCVLEGGLFAVYPFQGYLNEIISLHQKLIGVWFPSKQLELDERYSYDQYTLVREDGYMEFDICIPIKKV